LVVLSFQEDSMRAAIYARVSTVDQEPENQLQELRRYVEARSWTAVEYVDRGVSGAKDRRPALDQLVTDAKATVRQVAIEWGVSKSTAARWIAQGRAGQTLVP
jgi:predicted site-specific integrase-resolvase